jgi:hypothetical protein
MKTLLEQFSDNNFLITTDNWFIAPDGKQYRSVWGRVEVHSSESTLGIKTNIRSTNWYAIIGVQGKRVIIAGCQIHYACVCMDTPNVKPVKEDKWDEKLGTYIQPEHSTNIYLAQ